MILLFKVLVTIMENRTDKNKQREMESWAHLVTAGA